MLVLKKIDLLVRKYTHLVAFMFSVLPNLVIFGSELKRHSRFLLLRFE